MSHNAYRIRRLTLMIVQRKRLQSPPKIFLRERCPPLPFHSSKDLPKHKNHLTLTPLLLY